MAIRHQTKLQKDLSRACLVVCVPVLLVLCLRIAVGEPETTQPQNLDGDAQRLTFLGNQLSADEAAITSINKALKIAGYHAQDAADEAAGAAKQNELMDRKGGGPVPWQEFYGRTAKSFIMHDPYGEYHQVQRPDQFDYVYKANDEQIAKAQADIESVAKTVDALLGRRRQLEAEQSSLWATIAFESIQHRQIVTRPLYREQLAAKPSKTDDNRPDGARIAAMKAAVLYLRTVDHAVSELADNLDTDQEAVYSALRGTLQKSQENLAESSANFGSTAGVDPVEAQQMEEVSAQAGRIQSICKDICESYRKAQDADAAGEGEEQRKLLFRGTLQESLFTLPEATGELDETVIKMAASWDIHGQAGTRTTDEPLTVIVPIPAVPIAPVAHQDTNRVPVAPAGDAAVSSLTNAPQSELPDSTVEANKSAPPAATSTDVFPGTGKWISLFDGKMLDGWNENASSSANVQNGTLIVSEGKSLFLKESNYENFRLRLEAMISDGGVGAIQFRLKNHSYNELRINENNEKGRKTGGVMWLDPQNQDRASIIAMPNFVVPANTWFVIELIAAGPHIAVEVNGQEIGSGDCNHVQAGLINFQIPGWAKPSTLTLRKIQMQLLGPVNP